MWRESDQNYEENSRKIVDGLHSFSPLGFTPFSSTKIRREGTERVSEDYLRATVESFLDLDSVDTAPLMIAVSEAKALVDDDLNPILIPKNMIRAEKLLELVGEKQQQAMFLCAGTLENSLGQHQRVLSLVSGWEMLLDFQTSQLNLLGPDGEQRQITDVLADRLGGKWVALRTIAEVAIESVLELDAQKFQDKFEWLEILSAANALDQWHRRAGFDPATGKPTFITQGGWSRSTEDGRELFPRTDPAVITAVTAHFDDEEHLLLGQARAWDKNRFSTFAGFVEAGESIENAVERELFEECGGRVKSMLYVGSQPWAFPRSLMLGFYAEISNPDDVQADGDEIETLRWFTREELKRAARDQEIQLPSRSSISRMLIEKFLGERLT